jgi:hypothetical protein
MPHSRSKCQIGAFELQKSRFRDIKGQPEQYPSAVANSDSRANASLARFVIVNHFSYHLLSAHCSAFGHIDIEAT